MTAATGGAEADTELLAPARQAQGSLPFEAAAAAPAAAFDALLRHAVPPEPGVWDELRHPGGAVRPRWKRFAELLAPPPAQLDTAADLDRRVEQVAAQIRLDGVTHNVFSAHGVASRPWSLELLPLLIEPAEWAGIEAGVVQRAGLLEAMLADLYGARSLLHQGLLPPALLLRHPGYLRPMHGVRPPGGLRLHIVAFDLARGADGRWWVVAQRTQGPSGLGYVLHNRLVISRQFPDAFRELRVQHIASSYRRLLDTVENMARDVAGGAVPRLALLTPGPYSETYFEHAYLARYLGLPLVEGGDLTVRNERVYLRTVEGLQPVHGLLRRLDDDWCDPLELRPDSALGVPGLLQAARAGTIVMANALGSAFLESPALQGFLPGICRRLLGEEMALPSLPSWWCGEAAAWKNVQRNLDNKVIRSTFPHDGRTSKVHHRENASIEQDPDAWTVQGRLRFSRAPIWGDGTLTPRPALVRVYAIADGGGRWHVLPGGMTRVSQGEDASVSMQRGGSSLDTWVLTDGPVDTFSMLPQRLQVDDIAERRRPVSSRTGENLFWLGRYTERTEQLVRLVRATLLLVDADSDADAPVQLAMSALAVRNGLAPFGTPTLVQSAQAFERAVLADLRDPDGASVGGNLCALQGAAQALRERLSAEQWGLMRRMGEEFAAALKVAPGELPTLPQVLPALDRLALQLAAVTGAQTDRMTRDHGWRLLTVGRLLERLIGLATRLQAFLGSGDATASGGEAQPAGATAAPVPVRASPATGAAAAAASAAANAACGALGSAAGTELLLELFDSAITFRARYQRHEDLLAITDLLVLDSANPRALSGVLRRLRTELRKLPGSEEALAPLLARLPAEGAGITLEQLRGASDADIGATLRELTTTLAATAAALADEIGNRFFVLAHGQDQRV